MLEVSLTAIFSYLIGSINPSYLMAKARGFDIRESGSGNAGGSNALITMGASTGVFCMLFDILKTVFAIRCTMHAFPQKLLLWCVSASASILGHMFPYYMQLRGGKGLACLGGVILSLTPRWVPLLLVIAVFLAYITDYICVVPITMSLLYPLLFGFSVGDLRTSAILGCASLPMLVRHRENLRRIRLGTEAHFSYLWNKEAETERLREAYSALSTEEPVSDNSHDSRQQKE